jgi:hypothetical protein
MTKKAKEALQKSIEHWERMAAWAKKQNKKSIFNTDYMFLEINESTGAGYCSLCDRYLHSNCDKCPLDEKYNCIGVNSPYRLCLGSKTWSDFVKNGTKFIKIMKELLMENK